MNSVNLCKSQQSRSLNVSDTTCEPTSKGFFAFTDDLQHTQFGVQTDTNPQKRDSHLDLSSSEFRVRLWWQRSNSAHSHPYAYLQGKYMIDCLSADLYNPYLLKGADIASRTHDSFADSKRITAQLLDAFNVNPNNKDDMDNMLQDYAEPDEDALSILKRVRGEDEKYEYECDDDGIVTLISEINQSGDDLLHAKRYVDAMNDFDHVLNFDTSNAHALHGKGIALQHFGRHVEAIQVFDSIPGAKNDSDILCHMGFSLTELGEYHKADECFDAVLSVDPMCEWALHEKGYVLFQLKIYEGAIACCNKLLEKNPENHKALVRKGFILLQTGKFSKAIDCFDAVLSGNNCDVDALDGRINALYKLGKYDEMLSSANDLLSANPDSLKAYDYKGHALIKLTRIAEALDCFDAMLRSNDDDDDATVAYAWHHKGKLHMQLEAYKDAIQCFVHVLDLHYTNKTILDDIALCVIKEINFTNHNDDCVAIDYSNLNLDSEENLMSYGDFLLHLCANPKRAIKYFDAILCFIPRNTETLCDKASVLFQLEKYDDSVKCINTVLATNPQHIFALNIKGISLLYMNKHIYVPRL